MVSGQHIALIQNSAIGTESSGCEIVFHRAVISCALPSATRGYGPTNDIVLIAGAGDWCKTEVGWYNHCTCACGLESDADHGNQGIDLSCIVVRGAVIS